MTALCISAVWWVGREVENPCCSTWPNQIQIAEFMAEQPHLKLHVFYVCDAGRPGALHPDRPSGGENRDPTRIAACRARVEGREAGTTQDIIEDRSERLINHQRQIGDGGKGFNSFGMLIIISR